jgi:hypothetical protein
MMSNDVEIKDVQLVGGDGTIIRAKFHIWDADPDDFEMIKLSLVFSDRELTKTDTDYFAALRLIRRELEQEGIRVNCYGASKSVYPSPMSLSMGAGEKAFRLNLGEHARIKSLVSIFDTGPDVILSTIEEQDAFFESWTKSVSSKPWV